MSPPGDRPAEAELIARLLAVNAARPGPRVAELGAGGGHLASHIKARFDMTPVDLSRLMLEQSRRLTSSICCAWRTARGGWFTTGWSLASSRGKSGSGG